MTLRVLLVDDNPQFLQAARGLLEQEGLTVAALASTTAEALERAGEVQPDVALVDIDLGTESGFDVAALLARADSRSSPRAVILISTYAAQDLAELIDASPAVGFLSKSDLSARAILDLVTAAQDGG